MAGTLTEKHLGSLPPVISRRLCEKAGSANDQLTPAERWLFLSRLDLAGQALAAPSSLSPAQLDQLRGRPPPPVLARIVRAATGLASVQEVVRAHWAPDRIDRLSRAAMETVAGGWWTFETFRVYGDDEEDGGEDEAVLAAAEQVAEGQRPEEVDFEAEVAYRFCEMVGEEEEEEEGEEEAPRMEEADRTEEELDALREEHLARRAKEAEELRGQLREQLERELGKASSEDLAAMRELRERMAVEVAEEVREDQEREREDDEEMLRGMKMLEVEEETDEEDED